MKHKLAVWVGAAVAMLAVTATLGSAQVVYDSTVSPLPGNLPSEGAEAYAFRQLGDEVTFAGTSRRLTSLGVTLSSWGCQSGSWYKQDCASTTGAAFNVPVTLNIYAATLNNVPGSLIATRTQTFSVPYRPSADPVHCTGGRWYETASGRCFNGQAANVTFDFSTTTVTLPNTVVYGIVYNTSHYGPNPVGESVPCFATSAGCPYDSLNIALAPNVTVGTKPYADTVYQDSVDGREYCDGGTAGVGTFRLDSPTNACWGGFIPAVSFTTSNPPVTANQCKQGAWQNLTTASGERFPNQGQCIQYANVGK